MNFPDKNNNKRIHISKVINYYFKHRVKASLKIKKAY